MINPYESKIAKVIKIKKQTPDTKLFTFVFKNKKNQTEFIFNHGQFMMAGLPGFGEAPFDICSNIFDTSVVELSIREVGELTSKFHELKVGDEILLRGPYGHGIPKIESLAKPNLLLIGGGCGFVTLKSIIEDYIKNYKNNIKAQVFYGALDENSLLFSDRHKQWEKYLDLQVILDKPKEQNKYQQGLITKLITKENVLSNSTVIMCGPPVMYRFVIKELEKLNFLPSDIYVSLERRMHCGVGICYHCAIGAKLVCKDGPVFKYEELINTKFAI
jgi:sulfhydrogenase subunit gamma (sulfur reductase)